MTKRVTRPPRDGRPRFAALMDRMADGLFLADATGRFIDVNQAACDSLRYTRKELLSLSVADIAEEAASKLAEALDGVRQAEPVTVDATHIRKDGTTFPVQLNIGAVEFDGEQCLLAVARDVSATAHAEDELRTSEERLKILFESAPDGVYLSDLSGKFVDGNAAAEELTGYSRDELIGKNFLELDLLPAEQVPKAAELLARNLSGQPTGPDDFTLNRKGGGQVTVEIRTFPVTVEGEAQVLGIARDVTERKRAEEALLSAEEQYRHMVEDIRDVIFEVDRHAKITYVSPAVKGLTGHDPSEVTGRYFTDFVHPEDLPATLEAFRTAGVVNPPHEVRILTKSGEIRWVRRTTGAILRDGRTVGYRGVLTDVTERKKAEEELREAHDELEARVEERTAALSTANERLRAEVDARKETEKALRESEAAMATLLSNLPGYAYRCRNDSDWTLDFVSEGVLEVTGYSQEELLVQRSTTGTRVIHTDDRDRVWDEVQAALEKGEPFDLTYRIITKSGEVRWVQEQGRAINAAIGDRDRIEGFVADVTDRRRAEEALRASEERYRSLFKDTPSALHSVDREGRLIEVSDHWLELLGYERKEVIGRKSVEFLTEDSRRYAETAALPDFWKTGRARNISYEFRRKNGEIVDALLNGVALRNEDGEFATSVASLTDVTERRRAEEALRESEEKFRLLAENAVDIVYRYRFSPNRGFDYISPAVTATTGYAPDEFYADPDLYMKIVHPDDLGTLGLIDRAQPGPHALRWLRKDGSMVWMELTYVTICSDDGTRVAVEGVARDITKRKKAEATIEHMAYHDSLTDLPNRVLLKDHLELAIAQARRSGRKVAAIFLDVDRFKVINDTLGHSAGDKLLQRIGKQLTRVVRDGDTVARVGGDEFILLLPDLVDPDDARTVAERALGRIRRKRRLAGRELVVTASLGISVYPSDGDDAETLLRHADTAMYNAKEQGRDQFEFYDLALGAKVIDRFELEGDLRRALEHDEFVLHYQPQIAIDSGEIVGTEALIRWQHPEKGLLLPNEFIGVAQDSGLTSRLDERTLRTASAQCAVWQGAHSPSLRLSVNFETNALLDRGLPQRVESILTSSGLAPASLVVEITEQHAVRDIPSTQAALRELKAMGVQIALDDFGTGHSSLAYLSQFPIDVVKIDRAFVAGIGRTPEDSAIVVAIASMARGLGIKVIAEGVETEEQLAFLKTLRCDEFQGYLFSRPVPPQEFEQLLSANAPRRAG